MVTVLVYKLAVTVLLAGVVSAGAASTYYYQQANTKISQNSDLNDQGQRAGRTDLGQGTRPDFRRPFPPSLEKADHVVS